ncbi:lipocalin-like [Aulostomus maculatus]
MRNALPILVCALVGCTHVLAVLDIAPMADFDLQRISGRWYLVGFATNAEWFVSRKALMRGGVVMMWPTPDGDLDLHISNMNATGFCWRISQLASKTETPGRFYYRNELWQNDNDMRIVDIVYDTYAIDYTIKAKDGVFEVLNTLYSRTWEAHPDLQEKFRQFSIHTGVLPENVVMLEKNADCPEVLS